MNDHYPDPGWYWQERLSVVKVPRGASTIAAKVRRWLLKSEERDNRVTFGLIHQRNGHDDHSFAPEAGLSRWHYRSSGMAQRTSAAFSVIVKRPKTPQQPAPCIPTCIP
ncbi:hypothetical protein [Pseudomonas chlororaphis]|uniref:hypothetical protein n=1 Tax=Pseudomonas chlororaphis TaxID=587753 RepID=UPI00133058C0|nr:hypothetical protein [Pseudomonas chlororaphis]